MYSHHIKLRTIALRREGYSYSYISKVMNISKSTLSEWLGDVPYVSNTYTKDKLARAQAASVQAKHLLKRQSYEYAKRQAQKDVGNLSKRDLFMLGLGIYIGEGTKSYDITRIINANPRIIKLSIRWFKENCGIETKNLYIRLHIYPDAIEKECISFWSKETGIPIQQFYPSFIDMRTDKKMVKKGKLPFGTAHLSIKSFNDKRLGVRLHRLILAWIEEVL